MKKHPVKITIVAMAIIGMTAAIAGAADTAQPSAKVTAQCTDIVVSGDYGVWTTVLKNTIKCANQKDLFIDVSLVSELMTRTRAKSKGGKEDTASAEAGIEVRVVIDENPNNLAAPGVITFAKRYQELSAIFQGLLTDSDAPDANVCLSADVNTGAITIDPNCLRPEEVELILETMTANSFNFIVENVTSGVHTIEVQVRPSAEAIEGDASASAVVGAGSVTVEEVRCIKDEDLII
ncbi:MAG: hypothetical protein ABIG61_17595 [Planctomycetota bacterium]